MEMDFQDFPAGGIIIFSIVTGNATEVTEYSVLDSYFDSSS
jgi:hypothetical protein